MPKIRINGNEIEADEGLLRRLIFGTEGGKTAQIEPKIRVDEPLTALAVRVEPEAKTCKVCKKPLGKKKKFLCGNEVCEKKYYCNYKRKQYSLAEIEKFGVKENLCKVCKKPLGKGKKFLCGDHECWKINHRKANKKYYNKTREPKSEVVAVVKQKKLCLICNNPLPKQKQRLCSVACTKKHKAKTSLEYYYKHKESVLDKIHEKRLKQIVVVKQKPKEEDLVKPLDRRTFITKRAKDICKYQGVSYERAVAMANQEWEGFQIKKLKSQAVSSDEEFPNFSQVSNESHAVLEKIFQHIIGVKGKLTYFDVLHSIQLKNNDVWNGRAWINFVAETLVKSKRILNYFGVKKGNFIRVVDGVGHEFLKYED